MRLYELFMGPLEATKPWQMDGVKGVYNFLCRVWRLVVDGECVSQKITDHPSESELALQKVLHQTIKKVTNDTANLQFNTAIAQMMIFVNEATSSKTLPRNTIHAFLKVLSAYAPHIAEELWQALGGEELISLQKWPAYDESLCIEENVTIIVQVNSKIRDKISAPRGSGKNVLEELALKSPNIQKYVEGKEIKKIIIAQDRLVNILV